MSHNLIRKTLPRQLGLLRLFAESPQAPVAAATSATPTKSKASHFPRIATPKIPTSGYNLFMQDPDVKAKVDKEKGLTGMSRQFSALWAKLPENDKQKYRDEHAELKKAYDLEHGKGPKTKTSRAKSSTPKAPSAYNNFIKKEYSTVKNNISEPKQAFAELAKKWKGLSPSEKQKYK